MPYSAASSLILSRPVSIAIEHVWSDVLNMSNRNSCSRGYNDGVGVRSGFCFNVFGGRRHKITVFWREEVV